MGNFNVKRFLPQRRHGVEYNRLEPSALRAAQPLPVLPARPGAENAFPQDLRFEGNERR
jgi:hypothetical protein